MLESKGPAMVLEARPAGHLAVGATFMAPQDHARKSTARCPSVLKDKEATNVRRLFDPKRWRPSRSRGRMNAASIGDRNALKGEATGCRGPKVWVGSGANDRRAARMPHAPTATNDFSTP